MSSAAEDILCEPHVDRELSDDDNGPGATSRPQSHGGQNKDPCWALVQCIPIKSPDNTMKTNVVCTLCHCSIGIYIDRVKVERFRKHFDQKQCIAADIPAKSVSQSIKKWTTPSLTSEQKEAYKLRMASFFIETATPFSRVENAEFRYCRDFIFEYQKLYPTELLCRSLEKTFLLT